MADFEVRRDDLRETRVTDGETETAAAADGEVQLRVARFGLTANNVTYGVMGEGLKYWDFFPTEDAAWGRVPVWGYGDVVASAVDGIDPGERFYGYFPMSTFVTMRAQAAGPGFVDASEHRKDLPATYNQYMRVEPDADFADEQLLLRPLFGTAFLLEDFLRSQAYFRADAVVLSSASSKTAYGLAFLLASSDDGPHVIGLTSERNVDFVESLNLYDRVIRYDAIADELDPDDDLVFVDMAGDPAVREAVHGAARDRLKHSAVVGATHWEELPKATGGELPGPEPQFFFAPDHVTRLSKELGGPELQRRLAAAWSEFAHQLHAWLEIDYAEGAEQVEVTWRALVDGEADPRVGHIRALP